MRTLRLSLIVTLLLQFAAVAQVEYATGPFYKQPNFFYDVLAFKTDTPGKTRVDFFVQVPFDKIQFVKEGSEFKAEYSVSVAIYDEEKEDLFVEESWEEEVVLTDYKQTNSKNNYNFGFRSFEMEPDKYRCVIRVEDFDSRNEYEAEMKLHIRDFDRPLELSDIIIIRQVTKDGDQTKVIPNVSGNIANDNNQFSIFYEIYTDTARTAFLKYSIVSAEDETELYSDKASVDLHEGANQFFFEFKNVEISLGRYKVVVTAFSKDVEYRPQVMKSISSSWIGVPQTIDDLEDAIDQMIYIASASELDYIRDAESSDERLERFMAYWREQDPSPATRENEVFNEYYRRIAYANENFSHINEGWRSDMGMVYCVLGPPSHVERHPFEYNSRPYEIWEYYDLNRRFVFVDQTGFDDYRLTTPFFGEYYRR